MRSITKIIVSVLVTKYSRIFMLGLWALPLITSGANTSISDSLKVVLSITSDPGRRIQIYTSLAEVYKSISADSCNFYLGQAQKLFPLVNPMPYLGKVYELKGDAAIVGWLLQFNNHGTT